VIRGVSHIGIAVSCLEESVEHYKRLLGMDPNEIRDLPDHGVRLCTFHTGATEIELMEPLGPRGESLGRFLDKRGEGVHHVCLEVDDVEAELKRLSDFGLAAVGPPRPGATGRNVVFLRPSRGVLVELAESGWDARPGFADTPD
jgi:methylmalonyl-CoA/ethylmalonyl-CoA epimerase